MSAHTDFSQRCVEYNKLLSDFKQLLRDNGLKFTIQREVILEMLYSSDEHLTPESLHHLIQEKHPDLNTGIATVYRTLSLLEDSDMVTSLSFGAQGKKYELGAKDHHDHIICTQCGEISEFVDDEIETRQKKIAEELGFLIQEHSMQIYGICQVCQSKMKK
ncbi:MAG: Fur family transcriptional regulator [Sulfuricurvum sp.]|jgi:Fur family ferric uptake transcriptional regulator|nr:Fur family transcriptional regulator [Sulfuricurvum sp.]MDP3023754.1 Fur family transcriptional regulator [Sulfuricurvum sp.]MDP3119086.1 Fur family transcriptional regulator [Sulfuricurvum sp.]